jgi:hypothetical protein
MSSEAKEYKAVREMPGIVKMYAASTPPTGYLLCDGSAVSRTTYADLFSVIGETWGAGDASTTFNVPDLVGAAPSGAGTSTGYTADETIVLGTKYNDQFQDHWHNLFYSTTQLDYGVRANPGVGTAIGILAGGVGLLAVHGAVTDGVTTPRVGSTTRGKRVGINFIIKT